MKCLHIFGITSMKKDTSGHLSGKGDFQGRARVTTLITLKNIFKASKRMIKMIEC